MHLVEASPDYLERLFIETDRPMLTGNPADRRGFWVRHRNGVPPYVPQGIAVGDVLYAEVKEGQWIVRCDGCANSQFTSRADKRFFCVCCLNAVHGGSWVKVAWPEDRGEDAERGEAVLLARLLFQHRNWEPHESVQDLIEQNREHGDMVPA